MTEREIINALHALTPKEFERFVAKVLTAEGYGDVRVQGGPDDRGIDILCRDQHGQLVAVQCKRFAPSATISVMVVQHLVGMTIKRGAHRAILATTGTFTAPARKQALDFDVELIDGPTLARTTNRYPALRDALKPTSSSGLATPSRSAAASPVHPVSRPTQPPQPVRQPIAPSVVMPHTPQIKDTGRPQPHYQDEKEPLVDDGSIAIIVWAGLSFVAALAAGTYAPVFVVSGIVAAFTAIERIRKRRSPW